MKVEVFMEEIFDEENKELNERLKEVEKAREIEESKLEKLSDEEYVEYLKNVYKNNSEILKKGDFNFIDDGEL